MLTIYNTRSKKKEVFKPLNPPKVTMYVCGMTVYDYCHMGHARVMVIFDMINRVLRKLGYEVNYIRNITDIDDKIINRAKENNETPEALAQRFIEKMHEDCQALNIKKPEAEPKATEHIKNMIDMIQTLIEKGHAYQSESGDVLYKIDTFKNYGKLANKNLDELKAGIRVEVNSQKDNPLDFVLWKSAKPEEPSWQSPWGPGRPGWHIECSAMSTNLLGPSIDIHGGGCDLVFPHHENEIAQSEAATEKPFAQTWIHAGFLKINQEKMSKSLGNFFTIREVLKKYSAEVVRYFLLSSHYRSPLNYSDENLAHAQNNITKLYTALSELSLEDSSAPLEETEYEQRFLTALNDDFNTPEAIAILFELSKEINRQKGQQQIEKATQLAHTLKSLAETLGLLQQSPESFLQTAPQSTLTKQAIEKLIEQREEARNSKNWALADEIRDKLAASGVLLKDDPQGGTKWQLTKT